MQPESISQRGLTIPAPNIIEIIGQRVELRRKGKEFVGLCPFHSEKTPSFYVNEEKGVYHCFGCHASGDVITFIMLADGLSFTEACKKLDIDGKDKPVLKLTATRKRAAQLAAAWVNEQRAKLNVLIAERLEQRELADGICDFELAEFFDRELIIVRGFYDDLKHPRRAAELLAVRESIEQITREVETTYDA